MYPEYRGNGVMASLGNIAENGHVGILFVDFFKSTVGLHVNGTARIVENEAVSALASVLERMAGVSELHEQVADKKKTPERWVVVEVVEAYIHCSKHIPFFKKLDKDIDWGTDSEVRKGGDYFKAKHDPRPWAQPAEPKRRVAPVEEPAPLAATLSCELEPATAAAVAAESEPTPAEPAPAPAPEPRRINRPIPEPLPALETTDPERPIVVALADDDDEPEFPVAPVTAPAQGAEKQGFGPEIALEERRADDDARAAAAEHIVEDAVDDLLDVWVISELTAPAPDHVTR
jgi:hypothetical protein